MLNFEPDHRFINGVHNEVTAKILVNEEIASYKKKYKKMPTAGWMIKTLYKVTPGGRSRKYKNALNELEYLTGTSWRRNTTITKDVCYIKDNFLVIDKTLINLNSIKKIDFNDLNVVMMLEAEVYKLFKDSECFKKTDQNQIISCDRGILNRMKQLFLSNGV